VELTFDPEKVSYRTLLDLFFELHDPTQVNRQGPDWGAQYRTVIFFHSPEQEATAREAIARLDASHKYAKPIATQVVPAETFWRAEEYHQKYLEKRGAVSCHI
jgi:peptide-methionine (S)-S-oxide reductase